MVRALLTVFLFHVTTLGFRTMPETMAVVGQMVAKSAG